MTVLLVAFGGSDRRKHVKIQNSLAVHHSLCEQSWLFVMEHLSLSNQICLNPAILMPANGYTASF